MKVVTLIRTDAEPIRSYIIPPGWAFQMRDENGATVQVLVTDLALENIGSSGSTLEIFRAHRSEIERLASDKYAGGMVEKDGTVRITSADVISAGRSG